MIFWITGRAGSGKTTLARKICNQTGAILIDGDLVRLKMQNKDYSRLGIDLNLRHIVSMALKGVEDDKNVVISCISPYREMRKKYQSMLPNCIEIQLPFGTMWEGTEYEE